MQIFKKLVLSRRYLIPSTLQYLPSSNTVPLEHCGRVFIECCLLYHTTAAVLKRIKPSFCKADGISFPLCVGFAVEKLFSQQADLFTCQQAEIVSALKENSINAFANFVMRMCELLHGLALAAFGSNFTVLSQTFSRIKNQSLLFAIEECNTWINQREAVLARFPSLTLTESPFVPPLTFRVYKMGYRASRTGVQTHYASQ